MPPAEDEFLAQAIAGDQDALGQLLERHIPKIRQWLTGKIPQRWQSVLSEDDVVQEAVTDAFLSIRRFKPRGPNAFGNWLLTLAKSNLLDAVKGLGADKRGGIRKHAEALNYEDSCVALYEHMAVTYTTPSRMAARHEAYSCIRRALPQLAEDHRRVIELYDLDGRSSEGVAGILNRNRGAMFMLRARALRRLAEVMGSESRFLTRVG